VLVVLGDPDVGRLAELTGRLSRRVDRHVQLVRLTEAEESPALMVDVIEQGRVLVDRDEHWTDLREAAGRWRCRARRLEPSLPDPIDQRWLTDHAA
jgi:hypothetical protein